MMMRLPGYFVGSKGSLGAVKCLVGKLLDVCLARDIVDNGIVVGALCFC
jgi:hypothetical protein